MAVTAPVTLKRLRNAVLQLQDRSVEVTSSWDLCRSSFAAYRVSPNSPHLLG